MSDQERNSLDDRSTARSVPKTQIVDPSSLPPVMEKRKQWLVVDDFPSHPRDNRVIAPDQGYRWNNECKSRLSSRYAFWHGHRLCEYPEIPSSNDSRIVLGYRITDDGPLTGIVVRRVQDPAETLPLLNQLGTSYVEWSAQGSVLRIVTRGSICSAVRKGSLSIVDGASIKVRDRDCYVPITGDVYDNRDQVSQRSMELDPILDRYISTGE
jgi:hypothetical protein